MAVNKVIYGDRTLVDLTQDSVNEDNLLEGETAHDASGNPVTGTAKQGHIVQNDNGTDMTQRSKVQFVGVYTEDDATNDRTKVNIVRPMTKEQYEALTPAQKKGFIRTTDEPDNPLNVREYVEVVADGEKTYSSLLSSLYALLDLSKVTESTVLLIGSTIYHLAQRGTSLVFSFTTVAYDGASYSTTINTFVLSATSKGQSAIISSTATYYDLGILKPSNGMKISIAY